MQIQINAGDIESSGPIEQRIRDRLGKELKHVDQQVTRIEVHLRDDKQGRHGPDDKRCLIEARITGRQPLAVECSSHDLYLAIDECAAKLGRAIKRTLDRVGRT